MKMFNVNFLSVRKWLIRKIIFSAAFTTLLLISLFAAAFKGILPVSIDVLKENFSIIHGLWIYLTSFFVFASIETFGYFIGQFFISIYETFFNRTKI